MLPTTIKHNTNAYVLTCLDVCTLCGKERRTPALDIYGQLPPLAQRSAMTSVGQRMGRGASYPHFDQENGNNRMRARTALGRTDKRTTCVSCFFALTSVPARCTAVNACMPSAVQRARNQPRLPGATMRISQWPAPSDTASGKSPQQRSAIEGVQLSSDSAVVCNFRNDVMKYEQWMCA